MKNCALTKVVAGTPVNEESGATSKQVIIFVFANQFFWYFFFEKNSLKIKFIESGSALQEFPRSHL